MRRADDSIDSAGVPHLATGVLVVLVSIVAGTATGALVPLVGGPWLAPLIGANLGALLGWFVATASCRRVLR